MSLLQQISWGLQALDCDFSLQKKPLAELIAHYLFLLEKWNRIYNLTAIRNPQDMLYQHVMDSLAVLPHINGPQIIDVGSGPGLPGIPIALAKPDWQVLLVESNQKKASFLQQVKIQLVLQNVTVMAKRIEDIQPDIRINTIITRAFSELGNFIHLTRQLAAGNHADCRWVAMKADCSGKELEQIRDPFAVEKIVSLTVPGLDAARQLIIIRKTITQDKMQHSLDSVQCTQECIP